MYAVDAAQCVKATACVPNFCHRNERRSVVHVDDSQRQRVLASALRTTNEVHRWEFPVTDAQAVRIGRVG